MSYVPPPEVTQASSTNVARLFGANASLYPDRTALIEGERQRLIPFALHSTVSEVDLAGGILRVDWHPDD